MAQQICPWCQSEIVWDEEFGPEKTCPHCYNELSDYRTIAVPLKPESTGFFDDTDDRWNLYTRTVERIIDTQEDVLECPQCQEYMVQAGEIAVQETGFIPKTTHSGLPPFLKAPFRLELFVCTHCFTALQRLAKEDRNRTVNRLSEQQTDEEDDL